MSSGNSIATFIIDSSRQTSSSYHHQAARPSRTTYPLYKPHVLLSLLLCSILILPPSPRSSSSWRSSASRLAASSDFTVSENSTPTLRSSPVRSLGSTFVPNRFHTSGDFVPGIHYSLPLGRSAFFGRSLRT